MDVDALSEHAVALCDRGGLGALTVRAAASSLGVAPASLYSRVDSVDDLFDLALDRVLGSDSSMAAAIEVKDLRGLLLAYFRHLERHGWACQIIGMRAPRGPNYLRLSESLVSMLNDGGVSDPLGASYALSNLVIGSAMTAPIAGDEQATDIDASTAPLYSLFHERRTAEAGSIVADAIDALLNAWSYRPA